MANNLYDLYVQHCLDSSAPDLSSVAIKLIPVCISGGGTNYTVAITTHDYLDDVTAGARAQYSGTGDAESNALGTKTIALGVFDSAQVTWPDTVVANTGNGSGSHGFVMYYDTGTDSTSDLIAYYDTGTGIPFVPSGGNITVDPNASGWFDISST